MDWNNMEPMKYWSFSSSMDKETRQNHIDRMIASGEYLFSQKYDGNWARAIVSKDFSGIQTRGISKTSGTYGEIQDKVFFWDAIKNAFSDDTVLIGEVFIDGGVDKSVGSILRCKPEKAKSIQSNKFYELAREKVKFSAKDKRDIEGNEFRNKKLTYRIFDVLCYDGKNLMDKPIIERIPYIERAVEKIDSSFVKAIHYEEMDDSFIDKLYSIFNAGGEGVVCYKKDMIYEPGKRKSWATLKVKRELQDSIDCFICGVEPPIREYTGKYLGDWQYWENAQTGEKLFGSYFSSYQLGELNIEPITKSYFNEWPGAIKCGVFDENNDIYVLCKCSGLTEDFKEELKNNYNQYHMMPIKITGMAISTSEGLSVRHPKLVSLRENDIELKDCSLEKIKEQL